MRWRKRKLEPLPNADYWAERLHIAGMMWANLLDDFWTAEVPDVSDFGFVNRFDERGRSLATVTEIRTVQNPERHTIPID